MLKQIMSVHDNVSQVFSHPFFAINVGSGIRDFHMACKDQSSTIGKCPEDFSLFHLGEFEDTDASFSIYASPVRVALGIHHKE